jgi:hypothetical protein
LKNLNRIRVVTSVLLVMALGAFAQARVAQKTDASRAEIKSDTRAANKANELWRGGEAPLPEPAFQSQKSREDRKAETLNARQRGEILPPGLANFKAHTAQPPRSDRTRAERKAETLRAVKDGTLAPAGEAEDPTRAARTR